MKLSSTLVVEVMMVSNINITNSSKFRSDNSRTIKNTASHFSHVFKP